ncbi:MAG: hypothetical protein Q9219_006131 [cf. Caloplaca sp. 3 TL-2023]
MSKQLAVMPSVSYRLLSGYHDFRHTDFIPQFRARDKGIAQSECKNHPGNQGSALPEPIHGRYTINESSEERQEAEFDQEDGCPGECQVDPADLVD